MSSNRAYLTYASANAMLLALAKGTSFCAFSATADVKVQLLKSTFVYTPSLEHLDDVDAGDRVGGPSSVSGFTAANGVLDAADPGDFSSVTGDGVGWWCVYDDTGAEATSLILFFVKSFINRPTVPNGEDISAEWSNESTRVLYFVFPES